MILVPLSELFSIEYPKTLVLSEQNLDANGIIFVSSKGTNNGISARVSEIIGSKKYKAGAITVALKGSVMSAFLQVEDFYIAHQTAVLYPLTQMSDEEKLFYCSCLSVNKYRFNYGRQADRTLKRILVPKYLPKEFKEFKIDNAPVANRDAIIDMLIPLKTKDWKPIVLHELFTIKKGKRLTKEDMNEGNTPFIGAIDSNNGYREFINKPPLHTGNTITVNYNGSVAEAFYQPIPFWASDDVNVLYPKFEMSVYIALFIVTIIKREKYRFNFGRKWHALRMSRSVINLPFKDGKPDYEFMENFIKSLPYSASLTEQHSKTKVHIIKTEKQKGLSDEELIEKYEAGNFDITKAAKKMLSKPSPTSSQKSEKQKISR